MPSYTYLLTYLQRSKFQWTLISVLKSILLFADRKKKGSAKRLTNPRSVGLWFYFPLVKKDISLE